MSQPSYMQEWLVPGHKLTISSNLMLDRDSMGWVLDVVHERCGLIAAERCAAEMKRRRRERAELLNSFFVAYQETNDIDKALEFILGASHA